MNNLHKRRLFLVLLLIGSLAAAFSLALYALQQNINLFYTPTQIVAGNIPAHRKIRLGGIVKPQSLVRKAGSMEINFEITDNQNSVKVVYQGILPDLFKEGKGVVAEGMLNSQKKLIADQVLAKHDERYSPAMPQRSKI